MGTSPIKLQRSDIVLKSSKVFCQHIYDKQNFANIFNSTLTTNIILRIMKQNFDALYFNRILSGFECVLFFVKNKNMRIWKFFKQNCMYFPLLCQQAHLLQNHLHDDLLRYFVPEGSMKMTLSALILHMSKSVGSKFLYNIDSKCKADIYKELCHVVGKFKECRLTSCCSGSNWTVLSCPKSSSPDVLLLDTSRSISFLLPPPGIRNKI